MAIKLSKVKPNPENPRLLKDYRFWKLLRSIFEFPKALSLRPMVVDGNSIVLGGNMRLKGLEHIVREGCAIVISQILENALGAEEDVNELRSKLQALAEGLWDQVVKTKSIPDSWVISGEDLTEEEMERFMVIDNVGFGEWDWSSLANETFANFGKWDAWGFEMPKWMQEADTDIDDFFEKAPEEGEGGEQVEKGKIVLNYTLEEADIVKAELLKVGQTPEDAVWKLLGLPEFNEKEEEQKEEEGEPKKKTSNKKPLG